MQTLSKNQQIRKRRRDQGHCRYCSHLALISFAVCEYHRKKGQIKGIKRVQTRMSELKCIMCGRFLDPDADGGRVTCISCREGIIVPTKELQLERKHNAIISN